MTRLVVHAGTHGTRWAVTWRQLVSWREPLAEVGVRLHPADDAESWLSDTHALATGAGPAGILRAAVEDAVRDDAEVVLLSSDRLEDPLRHPAQLANLESFAAELGLPLTVLVVVRDQLGYLNQLYCERVGQLQMARDFPSFIGDPNPPARFAYDSAFRHLIDSPDATFVALPYSDLRQGAEAKALLAAGGVDARDLGQLPDVDVPEVLPGPVLVAAYRLLFKRLWRLGLINALPRPQLALAGRRLSTHADQARWDGEPFWGWHPRTRSDAVARFGPGNDAFAEEVWHRPWGDDWEDGDYVDMDLPAHEPRQVVDLLDAVDAIVAGLQASRGPTADR